MKIILISRFYPPDTGGGGIAAYARYAAIGFTRAGHHVRVLSAKAVGSLDRQIVDGVDVFRISPPFSSYYWTRLPMIGRQMRFIRDLLYALRIRQLLESNQFDFTPDIVEYADIDAESFFHPVSLCPHVVKLHTPHAVLKPYYSSREVPYDRHGIEWMEKKAIQSASGISSPSLYLAKQVADLVGIAQNKIQCVPNFIDMGYFSPSSVQEEKPLMVLYVGRLEPRKGAVVFAEAIPMIIHSVPNAHFVFLGADCPAEDGTSQKSKLEDYFRNTGVLENVEFYGHASSEVFLSFYRRASVFVLPSLFENSPYTLLEAMACGNPVVVSRTGGMTEMLLDGESGLFFEAGNSADMAEKVLALLQSSSLRISMGQAARTHAESEYSLNVGVEKTVTFYREVLSGNE